MLCGLEGEKGGGPSYLPNVVFAGSAIMECSETREIVTIVIALITAVDRFDCPLLPLCKVVLKSFGLALTLVDFRRS